MSHDEEVKEETQQGPEASGKLKMVHFGPARVAVVAFEKDGVPMPKKIIVADTVSDSMYVVAQLADGIELSQEEQEAFVEGIEEMQRQVHTGSAGMQNIMQVPIGPDGRPVLPPGVILGPGGSIIPGR